MELNHANYSWIIKKSSWGFPLNVRDSTIDASPDAFPEISSKISFDSELLKNILRHHNKWKPKYLDRKTLILFSFSISFFWRYTYHPLNVNGSFPTGFYKDFGAFSFWKPLVFTMGVSIQIDCDDHRNNQKEILFRGGFGGEGIFRSSWYWFPTYFNMSTLIYIKKIMSSGTGSAIL